MRSSLDMPDRDDFDSADHTRLAAFDEHRGLLFSIAYRMLEYVGNWLPEPIFTGESSDPAT